MRSDKAIVSYIKSRAKPFLLFALFSAIFATVTTLSNLPADSVGYSFLLCLFIGCVVVIVDFRKFYTKHRQLLNMKGNIIYETDKLPPSSDIIESDYQELINILLKEKNKIEASTITTINDITDFYTLWAHQIKTPIAAMNLILQSEQCKSANEIKAELFRIEQYAEMVLSYLRLTDETSDLLLKEYELSDIVRQAVRKYSVMFIHKKIKLNLSDFKRNVLTDEKWLCFVIEQLLSNAIKYTAKGSISIYTDESGKLVIADTGIGIAADDLPRVFEKGYTGYNGRIDKKSTGIGLYLCKKALDRMGHTISIESPPEGGTRVIIGFETANIVKE